MDKYKLKVEIKQVAKECSVEGWAGYESAPITDKTVHAALKFIEKLPEDIATPAVGSEPDGSITLEWYETPRKTLSISLSEHYNPAFAAIMGKDSVSGPILGEISNGIINILKEFKV